jgi:metallo-beta-lactamase class B
VGEAKARRRPVRGSATRTVTGDGDTQRGQHAGALMTRISTASRRWEWRVLLLWVAVLAAVPISCAGQAGVPGNMQQVNRPFPPHRVIDNIYYVGTNDIAQFLIVTSAGNILLDTGFEASVPQLRENIEALGFRYRDIKLVLTSHAHIDHVQAHALVRGQTGAQVVVSEADATFVERGGKGETVYDGVHEWTPCHVDRRIQDGERVTLGTTTLTAHLTPGHTLGATTWTMQVRERGQTLDVVFFPSANVNPGVRLLNNVRYPAIARDFEHSFAIWKALECDVFLADHAHFYGMKDKVERQRDGADENPFIDPAGYRRFISEAERRFQEQLESER